jgi:hypothetical protein
MEEVFSKEFIMHYPYLFSCMTKNIFSSDFKRFSMVLKMFEAFKRRLSKFPEYLKKLYDYFTKAQREYVVDSVVDVYIPPHRLRPGDHRVETEGKWAGWLKLFGAERGGRGGLRVTVPFADTFKGDISQYREKFDAFVNAHLGDELRMTNGYLLDELEGGYEIREESIRPRYVNDTNLVTSALPWNLMRMANPTPLEHQALRHISSVSRLTYEGSDENVCTPIQLTEWAMDNNLKRLLPNEYTDKYKEFIWKHGDASEENLLR